MANILVTGANRGIGLELCRQYQSRGDIVVGVCRGSNSELDDLGVRVVEEIDVSLEADVATLATKLAGQELDILINNAGIGSWDQLDTIDVDNMLEQYRVNALGPLLVTRALQNNLKSGAKVAIISSRVGSLDDNSSGNNYGYRCSKAAVNMVGVNLHHDLSPQGVAVTLLHPGLVATDMTGGSGIAPSTSATNLIERIDELTIAGSGHFWHAEGYALPW